ncbi:uncharacterized protein TM35_000241280 [Trypanosoma theileri]|uniref:Uncharacterized protein n=1 Tax=Trypanosoma theileri TaxID=67003 RepID=A0A1X0NR10_9TRYP|nr:uncharacterized protein TM35_000241280 [Trypanosoma theileri]ORC86978.1 hypothetical protein TM35_000241280 [Trypanosoma theileri]
MKGFVLPSLKKSGKEQLWTSQVQVPSPPADLLTTELNTVLPCVDRTTRRQELKRLQCKAAALEAAAEREHLESLERRIRTVICGREHEKRYRMLWQYQEEKARVERTTAAAEAKALALQRWRYMQGVSNYKSRGYILHLETAARIHIAEQEKGAREHIMSLVDLFLLEEKRRRAVREAASAECIYEDLKGVRDWECRIAQSAFRPTKPFGPTSEIFTRRNIGSGGYRGRTDLLMDYTICEEEQKMRYCIICDERLERLQLVWQHDRAQIMFAEEPHARNFLEELCYYGSCQARLSAVLKIQRWWRMLGVTPWGERKMRELRKCVTRKRHQMKASEFRNVIQRMQRNLHSTSTTLSPEELENKKKALERAAEMSYQYLFDYFVYTLMNRTSNLQEMEMQRLRSYTFATDDGTTPIPPVVAPLRVPYRMYVRKQPVQPYPRWRLLRWIEGSTSLIQKINMCEKEETQEREALQAREEGEANILQLYHTALNQGPWAWRSLYTAVLLIEQEEEMCRNMLQTGEQDNRALVLVEAEASMSRCMSAVEGRWYVLCEEERQRLLLVEEEHNEFIRMTENEWRWDNLLRFRIKFKESFGGTLLWKMAFKNGMGRKFVSLDSVSCIIQRFFHSTLGRMRRKRERIPTPEAQLKKTAEEMVHLLELQWEEERQSVWKFTQEFSSAETHVNTAVELFSAWFDEKAEEPMEREYKAIVARFLQANKELYKMMHILFSVVRNGRERIEDQEKQEREALRHTKTFIAISVHHLCIQEASERENIMNEFGELQLQWEERAELLLALARSTAITTTTTTTEEVTNKEKVASMKKSTLPNLILPSMSPVERMVSRENITRKHLSLEERRGRAEFLLSLHVCFRSTIMQEEHQELLVLCEGVDSCISPHPLLRLLMTAEEEGRRHIQEEFYKSFAALLERGCVMYRDEALLPRFLRGHLSFASEARYFDRHLTELLLQRLAHMGSKINELIAAETCARARVEYMEEIQRRLYLRGGLLF